MYSLYIYMCKIMFFLYKRPLNSRVLDYNAQVYDCNYIRKPTSV